MNHRAEARQQLKEKIIEEEAAEKNKECCWNCHYMQWMVSIGQGVRCGNKKNEYRIFREKYGMPDKLHNPKNPPDVNALQRPVIPGIWRKCEYFENKWEKERIGADTQWNQHETPERQQNQVRMPSLGCVRFELYTHGTLESTASAADSQERRKNIRSIAIGQNYESDPYNGDPY